MLQAVLADTVLLDATLDSFHTPKRHFTLSLRNDAFRDYNTA